MASVTMNNRSPYWQAMWYSPQGKRMSRSTRTASKREALRLAHAWEAEDRQDAEERGAASVSVAARVQEYVEHCTRRGDADQTLRRLNRVMRDYVLPPLGRRALEGLTRDDMKAVLQSILDRRLSNRSATNYWLSVTGFMNWAVAERYISDNRCSNLKTPRATDRDRTYWHGSISTASLMQLIDRLALSDKAYDNLRSIMIETTLGLALRRNEVWKLKVRDFQPEYVDDPDRAQLWTMRIDAEQKNRKQSRLPVPRQLTAHLREWIDRHGLKPGDQLFPGATYSTLSAEALRADLEAHGLPSVDAEGNAVTVHSIRGLRLSTLANGGMPPAQLKTFARHANIQTTMTYYVSSDREQLADRMMEIDQQQWGS